jgi:hypothetical protein
MQKLVPPCGTQTLCILTLCLAKKALQNDQNGSIGGLHPHLKRNIFVRTAIEAISRPQVVFDGKARAYVPMGLREHASPSATERSYENQYRCCKQGFNDLCKAQDSGPETLLGCLEADSRDCPLSLCFWWHVSL